MGHWGRLGMDDGLDESFLSFHPFLWVRPGFQVILVPLRVNICISMLKPILPKHLGSFVTSEMKVYLDFHRKPRVGIYCIMIQWCAPCWALQMVLRKYLKWSTVIRKKFLSSERNSDDRIIVMQARSWVLSNWSRERRGEWVEREGRGMWEFQWAIAWMPSLYNSSPRK